MNTHTRVKCAVCGSTSLNPVVLTPEQEIARQNVPEHLPYEQCVRCGLWLQFPPPPFQYEADDKLGNMKANAQSEAAHFEWLASRLYKSYKPKSVLDIGCSYPLFLHFMLTKHDVKSVLGIDGSPYSEEYGKELGVPMGVADFMEYDFDRKYDLISMTHIIEHFHNPLPVVMKVKRLLNPGGVLFVRTPLNDTTGLTRWHLTEHHFKVHPIVFGRSSLKMLMEMAGMASVYEAVSDGVGHGDWDFKAK